MDYAPLGRTGVNVARICLGTVFRSEMDEATCLGALQAAADQGCNFLDCANIYRDGFSERVVGKFLKPQRDKFILTTKVGSPSTDIPCEGGLGRSNILKSAEASLTRLDTDYIDLFLCHFPDPDTPVDETLGAMDTLVKQGKVRFPGCSNFQSWLMSDSIHAAQRDQLARFECNQVLYSLLDRHVEDEIIPYAQRQEISITLFATTVIGLLSGRYRYGQPPPEGTSWHRGPYNYHKAMTPWVDRVIEAVIDIAAARGKTPTQVAMAWCLAHPGVTSVIIGADTPDRVAENWGAIGWTLTDEEKARLDEVSEGQRLVIHKDCPQGYKPEESPHTMAR